ncbi:phosphoadenosine phosphosulfate reductase domain-containing protein [Cloacibacillus evryensis]|uniref:Phosphoadenosine phosphosulfate reductase family protein n=1 Tax=Cloacibacillus evryensis TaxID=508460 RepID=A0AAW5K884_9BACT|nr:phosphoadenosine phosphosulfate reductase family protein [Cloacibacillus evryensis]MCQ4815365.1 phosphoadenosine phosphosulfate reductase family protein [Cloacibacillus evryensis]
MWCKNCSRETVKEICELCGQPTDPDAPLEIYWCDICRVPLIKSAKEIDKSVCPACGGITSYLCTDLRPVFPEERLFFEIIQGKPLAHINDSVWACDNRYYINGKPVAITSAFYKKITPEEIRAKLEQFREQNGYAQFNFLTDRFITVNKDRLSAVTDEAHGFIAKASKGYKKKEIVISFSGGKDSTVTADLVTRALQDPSVVHIFGDTTLEFPLTIEYAERFRRDNPKTIFKVARNNEQDFYSVCNDIGPPARMLRWCCSMFKTGPITRTLNRLYGDKNILTFYGIRKCESVSRSRYNRIEDDAVSVKIQKQRVASPIFLWKDIDVWLYILGEHLDFNDAYRLGYDRVGCWCCPNNNARAQFLAQIYMPEQFKCWRNFLISFAKRIGKPDAEEYIDSGAWKARQGGNGVKAAQDTKIRYANCTTEDNAKVYQLNKSIDASFIELFIPFGRIAPELGRKLINETVVVDLSTNVPIISIQPFAHDGYEYSVKVKTMNVAKHDDLHRMIGYQIKKYNACRKCLKCESLCRYQAISITNGVYHINAQKCKRCKMCVTAKYLEGGCLMEKYLKTKGT